MTVAEVAGAPAEKPLRADAERNRRRIVDAAGELFARRGLDATLNDVAHHAGVGVGTIYRRYPDKELLIDALFEERVAKLAAVMETGLHDADSWHGLVSALSGALELQEGDRGLQELLLSSGRGRERVIAMRERVTPILAELVDRARAAGALRSDVEQQDIALIQIMLGAVIDCSREAAPGLWRRYLAIVLQGLRANPDLPPELHTPVPAGELMDRVPSSWRPPRRL